MDIRHQDTCSNGCCGICCTKIEKLGVAFGKSKVLTDVNLHIHCGELTAIIGPNGAGKSTLLKALLGEVKHTGDLKLVDAKGERHDEPVIGYVPQHLDIDKTSPTSVLDFFMACRSRLPSWLHCSKRLRKEIVESLARVKAEHLIDRRLGALSGGELQRVMLALALEPIPELLLLDEPVSGVDQNGLELFYRTVSELRSNYDLSVILVSHDLDLIYRYADRVVLLNKTVLCSGMPEKVFSDERFLYTFGMSWYKKLQGEGEKQ